MGRLVEGEWTDQWYDTEKTEGKFVREGSQFHGSIGSADFPAEKGRYHLYVSYACPWAHRTLIFRSLKGLEEALDVSVVHPHMLENGWEFRTDFKGTTGDRLYNLSALWEIYVKAKPDYTGRVTVPVLWDKEKETIVCNESSEIIRMLNSSFGELAASSQDYYPKALRQEIDSLNNFVYDAINNGVYKAGFATTQEAYEDAVASLFDALDQIEERLRQGGPYLFNETLTEADWRLFTTLVRFDAVYVGHFKCNLKRIRDYPKISQYLTRLVHTGKVADTVHLDHIKGHYYYSHDRINPTRIVPIGPADFNFL